MCLHDREHGSMLVTILEPILVSLEGSKPRDSPEIVQIFPLAQKSLQISGRSRIRIFLFKYNRLDLSKKWRYPITIDQFRYIKG